MLFDESKFVGQVVSIANERIVTFVGYVLRFLRGAVELCHESKRFVFSLVRSLFKEFCALFENRRSLPTNFLVCGYNGCQRSQLDELCGALGFVRNGFGVCNDSFGDHERRIEAVVRDCFSGEQCPRTVVEECVCPVSLTAFQIGYVSLTIVGCTFVISSCILLMIAHSRTCRNLGLRLDGKKVEVFVALKGGNKYFPFFQDKKGVAYSATGEKIKSSEVACRDGSPDAVAEVVTFAKKPSTVTVTLSGSIEEPVVAVSCPDPINCDFVQIDGPKVRAEGKAHNKRWMMKGCARRMHGNHCLGALGDYFGRLDQVNHAQTLQRYEIDQDYRYADDDLSYIQDAGDRAALHETDNDFHDQVESVEEEESSTGERVSDVANLNDVQDVPEDIVPAHPARPAHEVGRLEGGWADEVGEPDYTQPIHWTHEVTPEVALRVSIPVLRVPSRDSGVFGVFCFENERTYTKVGTAFAVLGKVVTVKHLFTFCGNPVVRSRSRIENYYLCSMDGTLFPAVYLALIDLEKRVVVRDTDGSQTMANMADAGGIDPGLVVLAAPSCRSLTLCEESAIDESVSMIVPAVCGNRLEYEVHQSFRAAVNCSKNPYILSSFYASDRGDSGSPVMIGSKVAGVHFGGFESKTSQIFMSLRGLSSLIGEIKSASVERLGSLSIGIEGEKDDGAGLLLSSERATLVPVIPPPVPPKSRVVQTPAGGFGVVSSNVVNECAQSPLIPVSPSSIMVHGEVPIDGKSNRKFRHHRRSRRSGQSGGAVVSGGPKHEAVPRGKGRGSNRPVQETIPPSPSV